MRSGSIAGADAWLNRNLGGYANWAVATNNSVLIVTYLQRADQPRQRASPLGQMYGPPKAGKAASAAPITDIWGR